MIAGEIRNCQECLEAHEAGEEWERGYWHPDICSRCTNTPPDTFEEGRQYCEGRYTGLRER